MGGRTLQYREQMTLRIREREWKEFHHDLSKVPSYLLKYIKNHDSEDMTLQPADLVYREGKQFVIEEITKEGAIILLTCEGQSDIAFPVTGYHLVAFPGGRYIIAGEVVQHTQYAVEMPNNYLKNILYPIHPSLSSILITTRRLGKWLRIQTTGSRRV